MPDKQNHCLDIQLSKGHPIKFLEFCTNFIALLKIHLRSNNIEKIEVSNNQKARSVSQNVNNSNFSVFHQIHYQSINLPVNNSNPFLNAGKINFN